MTALRLVTLVCTLALTACTQETPKVIASQPPPPRSASPGVVGTPKVTSVDVAVKKLSVPWGITFLPDGSALVTERDTRRIVKITQGPGHDAPYTTSQVAVIEEADAHGEGGLLGIAASPTYAQDQTLFLYYTTNNDNRVARWQIGGKPQPIVTGIPISGIHNGGRLAFGPDGYLYATTGDAGTGDQAQSLGSLGGKILRMTTDGKPAPGNPFNTLVWTYGHRNVQGISWDAEGRMWATEFGQNAWDEINLIEKGNNYGWPRVEGAAGDSRYVDPVFAFHTSDASCSGMAIAGDVMVVACLRGQRLWLVHLAGGNAMSQPNAQLVGQYGRLRGAAVAPDKSVWVLTNNHDGRCNSGCTIHSDDDRILRITVGAATA
jgi:glucose/arabinose dehydrogenase